MADDTQHRARVFSGNDMSNELTGFLVDSMKCVQKAKVIGAPIETGQTSFDNKVVEPYDLVVKGTIVIDGTTSSQSTIKALNRMIETRDFEFFSATDGYNGYRDLSLVQFPHERNFEKYDWIQCELVFTHMMMVQRDGGGSSRNSSNSDFRDTGFSGGYAI